MNENEKLVIVNLYQKDRKTVFQKRIKISLIFKITKIIKEINMRILIIHLIQKKELNQMKKKRKKVI